MGTNTDSRVVAMGTDDAPTEYTNLLNDKVGYVGVRGAREYAGYERICGVRENEDMRV